MDTCRDMRGTVNIILHFYDDVDPNYLVCRPLERSTSVQPTSVLYRLGPLGSSFVVVKTLRQIPF